MRQTNGDKRIELHEKLCTLLGSRNVYYQPPETVKLHYPCIIYNRYNIHNDYANNSIYTKGDEYQIMVITKDPDSDIVEKMAWFRTSRFDRQYVRDNLYHFLFSLYY